jgi:hypothetical protein
MSLNPTESHLPQDSVPKPSLPPPIPIDPLSSSLFVEPIPISNQESKRVQKKSRQMNQSLEGMSPTSGHHTGFKPPTSYDDVGGKVPTSRHHVGKKTTNRYRSTYQPMEIMLGRGSFMGIISSIVYSRFQAR